MSPPAPRPALRLIKGTLDEAPGWSWFCGHCAAAPSRQLVSPLTRVCGSCGMGLLLETRSDAAPGSDDAFLVIDSRLTVQAVSRDAERLLGINEDEMVDGPVTRAGRVPLPAPPREHGRRRAPLGVRAPTQCVRRPHRRPDRPVRTAARRSRRARKTSPAIRLARRQRRLGSARVGRGGRGQPRHAAGSAGGAPQATSAGGRTIVPLSRWPFSSNATIVLPTATAVPLSVCTWASFPSAER